VEAPLGVAGPVWADDEDFDLDWHLDHATLPSPDALPDYVGREMSRKLDPLARAVGAAHRRRAGGQARGADAEDAPRARRRRRGHRRQHGHPRPPRPSPSLNPANQRLTVGILSYDGAVPFGLLADRDLAPPVSEAAAAPDASLAELLG
jgi:hypothetical protein